MSPHCLAAMVLATAPSLFAQAGPTTWHVGGAGPGNFAAIQEAIDAAAPGDVVLVEAGNYAPFVLDKGLTILGRRPGPGTVGTLVSWYPTFGTSRVHDIPSAETVVLADMNIGELEAQRVHGTLSLSGVWAWRTRLDTVADVRVEGHAGPITTDGPSGRVSIHRCVDAATSYGQPWLMQLGGPLEAVLVTCSSLAGGPSYSAGPPCFGAPWVYYDSGPALQVAPHSLVVAGRTQDVLQGGPNAATGCIQTYGAPGVLFWGALARTSGVRIETSDPWQFPAPVTVGPHSVHEQPVRVDPTLVVSGTPTPGASLELRVHGEPLDWVRVEFGRGPAVVPIPGSPVPRLVTPGRAFSLGAIGAAGFTSLSVQIPNSASPGQVFWVQASAVDPGGHGRATNSLALVTRR